MSVRTLALVLAAFGAVIGGTVPAQGAERPGQVESSLASFPLARIDGLDVGAEGRIVVIGRREGYPVHRSWVSALLPSGAPDRGFGQDGTVQLEDDRRVGAGLAVQPDGRVLVASSSDPYFGPAAHLVRRLTRDGRPDRTFGGTGTIEVGFGGVTSRLTGMALQRDGRLVVVGSRAESSGGPVDIVVARYLPDGSADPGFGSNGVAVLPTGTPGSFAAVALHPDDGLVLTANLGGVPWIARLTAGGQLDESFGAGGGFAPVELGRPRWAEDVYENYGDATPVVFPNGRIRFALAFKGPRGHGYRMGVVGLTRDGHPDRSFGLRGRALGPRPRPPEGGESVLAAVGDERGGVLVGGGYWTGQELVFDLWTVIRRFRADGSLDRSFGKRGVVQGPDAFFGYPVFEQSLAFLDADTLVVAEHVYDGKYSFWGPGSLRTLHAGYDDDPPAIAVGARRCRSLRVRITDLSGLEEVTVRAGQRVLRRTHRRSFRLRVPAGIRRVSIRAADLAENVSTRRVRLPRC